MRPASVHSGDTGAVEALVLLVEDDRSIRDVTRMGLSDAGFTVVSIRYTLAPEGRYPTPTRQLLQALAYLRDNADRFHVDPDRFVLAGD